MRKIVRLEYISLTKLLQPILFIQIILKNIIVHPFYFKFVILYSYFSLGFHSKTLVLYFSIWVSKSLLTALHSELLLK